MNIDLKNLRINDHLKGFIKFHTDRVIPNQIKVEKEIKAAEFFEEQFPKLLFRDAVVLEKLGWKIRVESPKYLIRVIHFHHLEEKFDFDMQIDYITDQERYRIRRGRYKDQMAVESQCYDTFCKIASKFVEDQISPAIK